LIITIPDKKPAPGRIRTRARKPWIVPIPGTTKLHRLEENIGAADVELSADELRDTNSGVSRITVQGDRYPAYLQQLLGR
jgi:diketogulonate reductase-like aldo/keto reductase